MPKPASSAPGASDLPCFSVEMTASLPALRNFARGLCRQRDMADDLVQETLLKAWAAQDRFEPGTSMRAWTFVILRNAYLTDMRRNRFRGEYDEGVAERILTGATAAYWDGLPDADKAAALQRFWTVNEAVYKACPAPQPAYFRHYRMHEIACK